jgi:TetR/AcrR family fatty acid metabolism transcriptional regulator
MSATPSRQESQESRDEILRAASRLFASRGFHEASMSEIARQARVSKALIFWHFKSKEELFVAVIKRLLEPFSIDFATEAQELDEREQLKRLIELYVQFVRDYTGSVRFFLTRLLRDDPEQQGPASFTEQIRVLYENYRNLMVDLIKRGQEKGVCSRRLDAETAATFLLSTLNGLLVDVLFLRTPEASFGNILATLESVVFTQAPTASADPGTGCANG